MSAAVVVGPFYASHLLIMCVLLPFECVNYLIQLIRKKTLQYIKVFLYV